MKLNQKQLERLLAPYSPVVDARKKNLLCHCPKCGEFEFGISIDGHLHPFQCYRRKKCGFIGNIYILLSFLGKSREFAKDDVVNINKKISPLLGNSVDAKHHLADLPRVTPPVLWKRVDDDPYLRQRGFEDYQFRKFEL